MKFKVYTTANYMTFVQGTNNLEVDTEDDVVGMPALVRWLKDRLGEFEDEGGELSSIVFVIARHS